MVVAPPKKSFLVVKKKSYFRRDKKKSLTGFEPAVFAFLQLKIGPEGNALYVQVPSRTLHFSFFFFFSTSLQLLAFSV